MSGVKRTRDGVDALEHALRGVHTSENRERIISFDQTPGFVGTRSIIHVDVVGDLPVEREEIVHLPSRRRAARRLPPYRLLRGSPQFCSILIASAFASGCRH